MVILLLALLALVAGLLVDSRRRRAAERVRHATEIQLARAGLVAAHEDTRDALRVAAGWRAHAAELETITVVLAPREPAGLYPADAATTPGLHAVEGPDEPRPCLPPDAAWVPVDGREWATNGHVLVPHDGEPFAAVGWHGGEPEDHAVPSPERVRHLLAALPGPHDGEVLTVSSVGEGASVGRTTSGRRVCIGAEYEPLLRRGTPRQRADMAPVAVWADAALVAVVMPRRAP